MADFNIQPVATQIKPMPTMSLGDMLNIARGAQAYQQAQQMNPIALQKAQIEIGVQEQANIERKNMQTFFSDPNNFQTDGRMDIDKINAAIPKIAPLTGSDYMKKFSDLSTAQTQALSASQNLTQSQRQMIASGMTVLGRAGVQDPEQYIKMMDDLVQQNPNNPDLKRLTDSYKVFAQNLPKGPQLPDLAIKEAQKLLGVSSLESAFAPTISVTPEGRTVTTERAPGAGQPTATFGMAGGIQQPGMQPQAGVPPQAGAQVALGMRIPYPVRSAATPYIAEPSEQKDQAAGEQYRTGLVNRQTTLATDRRNVDEAIKQASKIAESLIFEKGGFPGEVERKLRSFVASDDYKMLAKDLANLQISNLRALGAGGNTVAGMDLTKVASGDESVPPETLIKIARRAQADMRNIDMQANGAEAFKQKFGDNNMKAYQQAWNANADSRIFEAMNIIEDTTDPKKQQQELNRLFPNAEKRKEFLTKYRNIKKLSESGAL